MKAARRQHFVARFYLRNFAEPLFSDCLQVYTRRQKRWERRTPDGVGWFPHLVTMIDSAGGRTDEFDAFLKKNVEDPATPALRKLAQAADLTDAERSSVAMFIALTAARQPDLLSQAAHDYVHSLEAGEKDELEALTQIWCRSTAQPYGPDSLQQFIMPSRLGGLWIWAKSLHHRLLQWQWHVLETHRENPFVTSDWPVYAEKGKDNNVCVVSFPVSSELALIIHNVPLRDGRDDREDVRALNLQTMDRASDFIACCRRSFPGDSFLSQWCCSR